MFRLNFKLRKSIARLAIILFTLIGVFAYYANMQEHTSYAQSSDSGYITESFVVDIKVDKDCIYHVTEKVTVNFKEPRRGIFHMLLEILRLKIYRLRVEMLILQMTKTVVASIRL